MKSYITVAHTVSGGRGPDVPSFISHRFILPSVGCRRTVCWWNISYRPYTECRGI